MPDKKTFYPIDQISLSVIGILSSIILGWVISDKSCGDRCFFKKGAQVEQFSWQNKTIGKEDQGFILVFNRPIDQESVEKNLVIDPPLLGKMSWSGRRMAYTLKTPIPYGETYQIQLSEAKEKFRGTQKSGQEIQPFAAEFQSRDRALAYIGTQAEEQGRLIYYNLTQQKKIVLTPPELVIVDFKFTHQGNQIIFSAFPQKRGISGLGELAIYRVNTNFTSNERTPTIEQILDSKNYQNHQFDVTPDGETLIVQRVNRQNPADFDLWMVKKSEKPFKLNIAGGQFLIAPDGQTLAVARGEGISLLPLQPNAEPLDFLPKFGELLSFSPDGSAAAMVDFNTNDPNLRYTRSLFYVNSQGVQKKLLNTEGSILDCQFNTTGKEIYCLITRLLKGEEYQEEPYFAKIEIATAKMTPLMTLPNFREVHLSLSPDSLAILFDQVVTDNRLNSNNALTTNAGESIVGGKLWLLIPPTQTISQDNQPELKELGLLGIRPQWSP